MIMYRIRGIHDTNRSICLKFYPFLITIQSTQVAKELCTFDKYPTHTTEQVFIELPRSLLYVALTRLCVQERLKVNFVQNKNDLWNGK